MANFFDKIGEMAKTAADKTGDMIEITRLNSKISDENAAIAKCKEQIGNFYWEQFTTGKELEAPVMEWCSAIKASQETIAATGAEISALKGGQSTQTAASFACPSCGAENTPGTRFCGNCGGKLS